MLRRNHNIYLKLRRKRGGSRYDLKQILATCYVVDIYGIKARYIVINPFVKLSIKWVLRHNFCDVKFIYFLSCQSNIILRRKVNIVNLSIKVRNI